jgi:O-methyltransferase involved in polyketide biosynthesis
MTLSPEDQAYLEKLPGAGAFNPTVPHPARRYNYWLDGKDNFDADRRSADEIERLVPGMRAGVRANREVLRRVVRHLTAEAGIRQFLDVGTGLPTANNTHEVAQGIAPESRVVYVDNDPLVLAHARALLTSSPSGRTAYIEADIREPDRILAAPEVVDTFDLSRPVALLLVGVLHFVPGDEAAKPLVDRVLGALPPGSFLFVTHVTNDFLPPEIVAGHEEMQRAGRSDFWMRGRDEVTRLFDGLELLEPGIVPTTRWRAEADAPELPLHVVNAWAGVGRKA